MRSYWQGCRKTYQRDPHPHSNSTSKQIPWTDIAREYADGKVLSKEADNSVLQEIFDMAKEDYQWSESRGILYAISQNPAFSESIRKKAESAIKFIDKKIDAQILKQVKDSTAVVNHENNGKYYYDHELIEIKKAEHRRLPGTTGVNENSASILNIIQSQLFSTGFDKENSIRGLYPKDLHEWLTWIQDGKTLYLNKEKVQKLIAQQRINLAEVSYLDLNSINNIIQNFKNPSPDLEFSRKRLHQQINPIVRDGKVRDEYADLLANKEYTPTTLKELTTAAITDGELMFSRKKGQDWAKENKKIQQLQNLRLVFHNLSRTTEGLGATR